MILFSLSPVNSLSHYPVIFSLFRFSLILQHFQLISLQVLINAKLMPFKVS